MIVQFILQVGRSMVFSAGEYTFSEKWCTISGVERGGGMERINGKRTALTILVALTLMFIWGNSLMPGTISGAISDWFGSVLSHIFGGQVDTAHSHGVLRKLAHGTEYLVLGVELYLLLSPGKPWTALALSGVVTALTDETIQLFVPERCGQIKDVWIDLGGFTIGVLFCLLVGLYCAKIHRRT